MKIEGPGKADITKKEEKNGVLTIGYMPMSPGEYDIHIKVKGKAIHGSPFAAKISGVSPFKMSDFLLALFLDWFECVSILKHFLLTLSLWSDVSRNAFTVFAGEGRKRSQMSFSASSEYTLGGQKIDLTNMIGVLKNPKGVADPCLLKKMSDGKLGKSSGYEYQ